MKLTTGFIAVAMVTVGCIANPDKDSNESAIVDPTPAAPEDLLGVVLVGTHRGLCSGSLIARDTVLTAGHCFCTEDIFGNNCKLEADVTFRADPLTNIVPPTIHGHATVHPDYEVKTGLLRFPPQVAHGGIKNDLAVIRLESPAPSYAPIYEVPTATLDTGTAVLIAGYGDTGHATVQTQQGTFVRTCFLDSTDATLNFDIAEIDEYEDDFKVIVFHDPVTCKGDSGGPLLDTSARTVYGAVSGSWWRLRYGYLDKATSVAPYFDWIKQQTCDVDKCSDKAEMCRCEAGYGDCDKDGDCQDYLVCKQDIGSTFGYPPDFDVCVHPGPIEGTCACRNSGLAQLCRADAPNTDAYDQCAKGFVPKCDPQFSSSTQSCGACSCVSI